MQELDDTFAFHVEHIVPNKHGGTSDLENLALACQHCNLHKGPNLSGIDSESNSVVSLYNPRQQVWDDHFAVADFQIVGISPTGRATVRVLSMNDADRVELRRLIGFSVGPSTHE